MTSDALSKEEEDLERPFTLQEKIKIWLVCAVAYPSVLYLLLTAGAWIRTFPRPPTLWYGFWVTEIVIPCMVLMALPFLFDRPRILRKRITKIVPGKNESVAERLFHKYTSIIYLLGLLWTSYDASSEETLAIYPKMWNWVGATAMALGLAFIFWVFRINKFAARVVHVQPGQKLVTTGPYSLVRHPMYMAIIPLFCGFPLSVGSFWGVIPMAICLGFTAIRTYDEERFLVETFGKEYEDYRKKVPYRMIPFVF